MGEFAKQARGSGNLASISKWLFCQGLRRRRSEVATLPLPPGLANDQPGRSPRESPPIPGKGTWQPAR
jgi:hypothetical protein